jgi:HEAT repeat protein
MTLSEPTFEDVVNILLDENQELPHKVLYLFSDIAPHQQKMLEENWEKINSARQHDFLRLLKRELENDTLLCFDVLARALLGDADPVVRTAAIRLLSDCESEGLVPALLEIAQNDIETDPRAEAVTALGAFVLHGELDEISKESLTEIEETLLQIIRSNEKTELRQRALESLGYSSRPETESLIKEAWQREAPMWKASAVFAMGRSCDKGWRDDILHALLHENEIVRLAAAKAAGDLGLANARPIMLKMMEEENDEAVFRALIWSLSEIGGEDVREYLLSLLDQYDDNEVSQIEYLEEALANLDFTEDMQDFNFLNYDAGEALDD